MLQKHIKQAEKVKSALLMKMEALMKKLLVAEMEYLQKLVTMN